jgi:hypothetical protein
MEGVVCLRHDPIIPRSANRSRFEQVYSKLDSPAEQIWNRFLENVRLTLPSLGKSSRASKAGVHGEMWSFSLRLQPPV